jgi:sirohydrochlorin cobaltochelatase
MKAIIVLAMHGTPPNNFPRQETAELFSLQARLESGVVEGRPALERRYLELEAKMRGWPRTAQNDPFYAASKELGAYLSEEAGCEVIVGFNEFCAPCLDEALDQAVTKGAEKIIVLTPMMTRGGAHTEVDIPAAVRTAQARHPETPIIYAWPFKVTEVAKFLASHVADLV